MRLLYHVRCCVIFVRYSNQEFSLLLSINLSGCPLGYWTPRAPIFIWNLGSPYNWCATAQKKQSPPSPISSGLSPCLYDLVANNMLFCGKKKLMELLTFSIGPGFVSMWPESKTFISTQNIAYFKCFPIILACMPQLRLEISSVKRLQVPMCIVSVP